MSILAGTEAEVSHTVDSGSNNQKPLLDCFSDHIQPQQSLVFFYAKHVPFVEDTAGGGS